MYYYLKAGRKNLITKAQVVHIYDTYLKDYIVDWDYKDPSNNRTREIDIYLEQDGYVSVLLAGHSVKNAKAHLLDTRYFQQVMGQLMKLREQGYTHKQLKEAMTYMVQKDVNGKLKAYYAQ